MLVVKKKKPVAPKNYLIKWEKLWILLSTHILNILCRQKYDDCLKEKHFWCGVTSWASAPPAQPNIIFTWKNNYQTNYGYSDMGVWQIFSWKWTKWVFYFKENNWQYLPPMMKLESQAKVRISKNFYLGTVILTTSQSLRIFMMGMVVI